MKRRTITLALLCMFFVPGSAPFSNPQGKPKVHETGRQNTATGKSEREQEKSGPSKQKKTDGNRFGDRPRDAKENLSGAEEAVARQKRASEHSGEAKTPKPPTIEDLTTQARKNRRDLDNTQTIPAQKTIDDRGAEGNSEHTVPDLKFLQWEETRDASGRTWTATSAADRSTRIEVSHLEKWLKQGNVIVNEGSRPRGKEWRDLNDRYPHLMIFHEPESANRDPQAIREAIELSNRPLNPARLKVFNALPRETQMQKGFQERDRMGIGGTQEYWNDLHREIRARSGEVAQIEATKEAVLEELRTGTSDVLMLYAHSDGEHLIMPGINGGTISAEELRQIDRRNDSSIHERLILLVACGAGARTITEIANAIHNNRNATPPGLVVRRSLASVLLENGIGRAVMATDRAFDSREIPALLTRLLSGVPVINAVGQTQSGRGLQLSTQLQPPAPPIPGVPEQVGASLAMGL